MGVLSRPTDPLRVHFTGSSPSSCPCLPPDADFSVSLDCATATFTASRNNPGDIHFWRVGENNDQLLGENTSPVIHTYTNSGTFTVTHTIQTSDGRVSSSTRTITVPAISITQGLLSEYLLDNNGNDNIGGNNGTIVGNPTAINPDRCGSNTSAYRFDGNDAIDIVGANSPSLYNNQYTYSIWVRVQSLPSSGTGSNPVNSARMILSVGNVGADQVLGLFNNYFGSTGFGITSYGTTNESISTGQLPNINQWYFLTVTRDGNALSLYVDGQLAQTTATKWLNT